MEFNVKKITAKSESGLEMSLGEVIKMYRKRQRLTQVELARLVGLTGKTISNYENDSTVPDVETFIRLRQILKIPSGIRIGEPFDALLTLYCPDGCIKLDGEGMLLGDSQNIKSELFMDYGCRKLYYSCVKLGSKVYLLYNETDIVKGNTYLVRPFGSDVFVMAKCSGKTYTDINTGKRITKIDAVASRVLGEVADYEIIE